MAYRNARSNPILLRLGAKANWISNDFRKYDYNLEVLKNVQVYNYLDYKFSDLKYMRKVLFFSHITMKNVEGKCLITIHFFDRRFNLSFRNKSKRLVFKLIRTWQQRTRVYWLRYYHNKKNYSIKGKTFNKIVLVVLKFVLPYIKYYHLLKFKRYTGVARSEHLLLAKYINEMAKKNNLLHLLSKINKVNTKFILDQSCYIKLVISLKNYLLSILHFIKIINFIFNNKDKFKSVLDSKATYHRRIALLLSKIQQHVKHDKKIRKILVKRSLNLRVKRRLKKLEIKTNIKTRLLRIEGRFKAKLYRKLQVPMFFYSRKAVSKSPVYVYLYKYSKSFRTSLIMAKFGLIAKGEEVDNLNYILLRRLKKRYKRKAYKLATYRSRRTTRVSNLIKRKYIRKLRKHLRICGFFRIYFILKKKYKNRNKLRKLYLKLRKKLKLKYKSNSKLRRVCSKLRRKYKNSRRVYLKLRKKLKLKYKSDSKLRRVYSKLRREYKKKTEIK